MTAITKPFLPPTRAEAASSQAKSYWRAMTAQIQMRPGQSFAQTMERLWGREEAERYTSITRAASTVATTGNTNVILPISIIGSLPIIAPRSASAVLAEKCLSLDFTGVNQAMIPSITTPPTGTFIAEGSPLSIVQPVFGSVLVGPPRKILFGAAVTAELAKYSPEVALNIIRSTITRSAILALDTALWP